MVCTMKGVTPFQANEKGNIGVYMYVLCMIRKRF